MKTSFIPLSLSNIAEDLSTEPTFPQFTRLPPEIRIKIWELAYPLEPGFLQYCPITLTPGGPPGFLQLRDLKRFASEEVISESGYYLDQAKIHSRVPPVFYVNYEARDAVIKLTWKLGHKAVIWTANTSNKITQMLVERPFIPGFDTIGLGRDWRDGCYYWNQAVFHPRTWDFLFAAGNVAVSSQAMTPETLYRIVQSTKILHVFRLPPNFPGSEDSKYRLPPSPRSDVFRNLKMEQWSGISWIFTWDEDNGKFRPVEFEESDWPICFESVGILREKLHILVEVLKYAQIKEFEVRPLSVVCDEDIKVKSGSE
ncbi:hypothetical protein K461DRAFT_302030 [Myriangium duriaei CBS 260.36]|uniref:2EXR domain-containing protein n=1 Tax=Myriangium duriaei CBS 260.36 TaxID=1168546 RepID=A0A9P4IVG9_9PEZI|nr:hypothetical protein K461DRAFT_302030 [Myriangium duriaei CBS 260.36]